MAKPVNNTPQLDSHPQAHNMHYDIKAMFGALGDSVSDDTPSFLGAISAAASGGPKTIFIPDGWYVVDGDAIINALYDLHGWRFQGTGSGTTIIQVKSGSSCAFGFEVGEHLTFEGINFNGGGKTAGNWAFKMMGNGRNNKFFDCKFSNAQIGLETMNGTRTGGDLSQNERNTYVACNANDCTTGYKINSLNSQGQMFMGGGADGCTTAFHGISGWAEFHSWFAATGGGGTQTAWNLDPGGAWISTQLDNCLDEGYSTSVILKAGSLVMHNTFLTGSSYTIDATGSSPSIDATNCTFSSAGTMKFGNSTRFYDRECMFLPSGVPTFAFDGINQKWHRWAPEGKYTYINDGVISDWSPGNHVLFESPAGYADHRLVVAPASPPSATYPYLRVYHSNNTGTIVAKDSAGTEHSFW